MPLDVLAEINMLPYADQSNLIATCAVGERESTAFGRSRALSVIMFSFFDGQIILGYN